VKVIFKQEQSSLIQNLYHLLLTDDAVQIAELFLIQCLKPSTELDTFNDLRVDAFNRNALKLDFEEKNNKKKQANPRTSVNVYKHIQRAYYHHLLWVQVPFEAISLSLNAESYGFIRSGGLLVPDIVASKPEDLPDPRTREMCSQKCVSL